MAESFVEWLEDGGGQEDFYDACDDNGSPMPSMEFWAETNRNNEILIKVTEDEEEEDEEKDSEDSSNDDDDDDD
jgi:hypothetical protein